MEHVGYKGSAPMHNDLLGGTIKLAIDTLPQNVPFMKDGKLRALAVTSPARAPMAPDVPSVLELGQKTGGGELPRRLRPAGAAGAGGGAAARGDEEGARQSDRAAAPGDLGVQGRDMTPQEFSAFVANQVKEWYQPVKDSGAKLN